MDIHLKTLTVLYSTLLCITFGIVSHTSNLNMTLNMLVCFIMCSKYYTKMKENSYCGATHRTVAEIPGGGAGCACNCGQLLHHQLPHWFHSFGTKYSELTLDASGITLSMAHTSFFLCFTMWVDGYKITVVTPPSFSWSLSFFYLHLTLLANI